MSSIKKPIWAHELGDEDLSAFREQIYAVNNWPWTCCTDYGDFEIDIYYHLLEAANYNWFDEHIMLYFDGWTEELNVWEVAHEILGL